MSRTIVAALTGVLFCFSSHFAMAADEIKGIRPDDAEMLAAINKARGTLREFFDALVQPQLGRESFLLKVAFRRGDDVEHIWLADLDFSGPEPRGVVANEPRIPGLRFMQQVPFAPADITDWMYLDGGRLVGGYTTRLIRDRMSPEERKEFDASAPYKF